MIITNGRQSVQDLCLQLGGGLDALPALLAANNLTSLTEAPADGVAVKAPAAISAEAAQVVRLLGQIATLEDAAAAPSIGTAAIGSTFIIN
jgi:hypothetical protein